MSLGEEQTMPLPSHVNSDMGNLSALISKFHFLFGTYMVQYTNHDGVNSLVNPSSFALIN